jgi:hypothetical protein
LVDLKAKPKTDTVWVPVTSKAGKTYDNIQKLSDITQLDDELSQIINKKIDEAFENGSLTDEKFKDWKQGFKYKHTDGWEYQVVDKGNAGFAVTRVKPFASSGGFRKGGSFTFLRTAEFSVGDKAAVAATINNQQATDNWKITWIRHDAKTSKDYFMMENQKQYTPAPATPAPEEKQKKDDSTEESEEEE